MRVLIRIFAVLTLAALICNASAAGSAASGGSPPFVVTASSGPQAGARITATVTRSGVTLPAALVPALKPGDTVDVDFPDYRRPPTSVNYHVNVAFITETAPQRWLFEHSTPADRLFRNGKPGKHASTAPTGHIRFVYGSSYYRGIPIFTIIPEDAKTRGVDGVRDYVNAHPSDFVAMSQSTNDAVDKYSFLRDFLSSLANGSIDPATAQARVESVTQGLGVPPGTIDACYVAGEPSAVVNNCVQQAISGVVYQTNFAAPTQAQFLGGVAGGAEPLALAPYLGSLLTVWSIFVHTGHLEYEYLPATITLADPSTARRDELLMGLKVPAIRPPAAVSDVLFFTIGDSQAGEQEPAIDNAAPETGVCERTSRITVPMHVDHTSRYVHDAALLITPDGHAAYRQALDPRTLDAPVVDSSSLRGSADGAYTVSLAAAYGFDPIRQPSPVTMRMAFPGNATWRIAAVPNHPPIAGGALDVIAASPEASCLSHAELQVGSASPIPLDVTPLDDGRVELRAKLAGQPAGTAEIRFEQDDPRNRRRIENSAEVTLQSPPAAVDAKSAVAALGDTFLSLAGSGFERIRGVLVNGATYLKEPSATSTSACFDGPPVGASGLVTGQRVTAQLQPLDTTPGEVFPLTVTARRPALAGAAIDPPASGVHLSTAAMTVTLDGGTRALPRSFNVRVRQAPGAVTPCEELASDSTAVAIPAIDVEPLGGNRVKVSFAPAILHERAYGTLEMSIVDAATALGSQWVALPGTFARAPAVTQIVCPSDATQSCRLYGSGLGAIAGIQTPSGASVPPDPRCPPTDKGVACVYVPHLAHYVLQLIDGDATETLPDIPAAH